MRLDENILLSLRTEKIQQEFYDEAFPFGGSFGVRVSRGGRRVFFLVYKASGKRRRLTLGTYPLLRLDEARRKALRIMRHGQADILPETFGELCEHFLSHGNFEQLAKKTQQEYGRIIRRELLPKCGDLRLDALSRASVLKLAESIGDERGSAVMAARSVALISRICNFGIERELISENVAERLSLRAAPREPAAPRVLEWSELEAIWSSASFEPLGIRSALRFLILSGQLVSCIAALRWSDIELDDLLIRRADGTQRVFPLSPQAQQLIRELRPLRKTEVLFPTAAGGEVLHLRKALTRVVKRANVPPCSSLDIRRFVEYSLRRLRVRPDVIDQLFGRASRRPIPGVSVEYDYREEMRAAITLWGRKVFEHVQKEKAKKKDSNIISLFPD